MASMSRNNSTSSLMGFSVHQPAIGAALQFYPAMGSQELDDLINAYVPGPATLQDKRMTVSLEFFDHTLQTGDLFKFFLVYPSLGSSTTSPASSSAMHDSGCGSSFNTSPVISENQWVQMNKTTSKSSGRSNHPRAPSSSKKVTSSASRTHTGDFSHIPGMKIMTRDGLDVTNSASRGCKTKEQRDHAHLMRIIRACDACKKKKTRCDPSHKKRGSSSAAVSPEPKAAKKVKTAAPAAPSPAAAASFESITPESLSLDESFATVADMDLDSWDQFIQYDPVAADAFNDYDFFFDPAGYYSPATSSNSASTSPSQILSPAKSQPMTPAGVGLGGVDSYASSQRVDVGIDREPVLPYLNPGGVDVGNYVDFALYSPGSTVLDDELAKDIGVMAPATDSWDLAHEQRRSRSRRGPSAPRFVEASIFDANANASSRNDGGSVAALDNGVLTGLARYDSIPGLAQDSGSSGGVKRGFAAGDRGDDQRDPRDQDTRDYTLSSRRYVSGDTGAGRPGLVPTILPVTSSASRSSFSPSDSVSISPSERGALQLTTPSSAGLASPVVTGRAANAQVLLPTSSQPSALPTAVAGHMRSTVQDSSVYATRQTVTRRTSSLPVSQGEASDSSNVQEVSGPLRHQRRPQDVSTAVRAQGVPSAALLSQVSRIRVQDRSVMSDGNSAIRIATTQDTKVISRAESSLRSQPVSSGLMLADVGTAKTTLQAAYAIVSSDSALRDAPSPAPSELVRVSQTDLPDAQKPKKSLRSVAASPRTHRPAADSASRLVDALFSVTLVVLSAWFSNVGRHDSLPTLVGTMLVVVLSLVAAARESPRQTSVSCMNKLDRFTQALRLGGGSRDLHVKSKIHAASSFSSGCSRAPSGLWGSARSVGLIF